MANPENDKTGPHTAPDASFGAEHPFVRGADPFALEATMAAHEAGVFSFGFGPSEFATLACHAFTTPLMPSWSLSWDMSDPKSLFRMMDVCARDPVGFFLRWARDSVGGIVHQTWEGPLTAYAEMIYRMNSRSFNLPGSVFGRLSEAMAVAPPSSSLSPSPFSHPPTIANTTPPSRVERQLIKRALDVPSVHNGGAAAEPEPPPRANDKEPVTAQRLLPVVAAA